MTSPRKAATTDSAASPKTTQQARKAGASAAPNRMDAGPAAAPPPPKPPRLRLKLNTIDDLKAELARLYRSGKAGERAIADVSKLANILGILGRLIVDNELAARVDALEREQEDDHGK